MDRRKAIKLLAGGTTVSLVSASPVIASVIASDSEQENKQLAMVIDLRRCNGCKACVTACGHENGNEPNEHRTQVLQSSTEIDGKEYVLNLPLLCNQCDNPVCTKVCPTGATFKRKEDGIVVVDSTGCIDCNFCVYTCPYDGVRFTNSKTGTVDKCNFCIQRTSQGFLPACVETCTGGARVFGDLKDPDSEVSKLLKEHEALVLQSDKNTQPNVYYIGLTDTESDQPYNLNSELRWQR
ncbi:4Fe-4S dicluster domain-containing protein [Photobacterium sagamiensis]|uniref:4Fe-4S dicluster domain-containing protein n=1 Tax=Photobacterium sagamiensis TaxID=2910241 RepID=UPI003D0C6B8F